MFHFLRKESGQVLLVVILVMVATLTIGLSIASKTITNYRTTTAQVESQKALSAAEAGIEQAIKIGGDVTPAPGFGINFSTKVTVPSGTEFLLNGGNLISRDDGIDLWLSDYSSNPTARNVNPRSFSDQSLSIWFGTSQTACDNPAFEIAILTGKINDGKLDSTTIAMNKYAYDPCPNRNNNFTVVGVADQPKTFTEGTTFYYQVKLPEIDSGIVARIVPLYHDGVIGVSVEGGPQLPPQGMVINSSGNYGSTNRTIRVFHGYPQVPNEFFPYNLFSP